MSFAVHHHLRNDNKVIWRKFPSLLSVYRKVVAPRSNHRHGSSISRISTGGAIMPSVLRPGNAGGLISWDEGSVSIGIHTILRPSIVCCPSTMSLGGPRGFGGWALAAGSVLTSLLVMFSSIDDCSVDEVKNKK